MQYHDFQNGLCQGSKMSYDITNKGEGEAGRIHHQVPIGAWLCYRSHNRHDGNAYMTDEAWFYFMIEITKGYREIEYLKEKPEWLFSEMLDGFGFHK